MTLTPFPEVSLGARLVLLVAVLATVAGLEYLWRRERATRWREYTFLLACATIGGVFGAGFDQLSATLSPEYFTVGKGIARADGFRLDVALLGFHAGFLAGAVASGVLMIVGRGLPLRTLARAVPSVPVLALLGAAAGLLLAVWLAPDVSVQPAARHGFRQVLGLHYGLYAGAMLGISLASVRVTHTRNAMLESIV